MDRSGNLGCQASMADEETRGSDQHTKNSHALRYLGIGPSLIRFGISTVSHRPGVGQISRIIRSSEVQCGRATNRSPHAVMAEANFLTKSSPGVATPDLHCRHVKGTLCLEGDGQTRCTNLLKLEDFRTHRLPKTNRVTRR
jgi:hypothetical protein